MQGIYQKFDTDSIEGYELIEKMKKQNIFSIVITLTSTLCQAQNFRKCIVYQFSGKDSTKKHIALVQTFNKRDQILSETFSNYRKNSKEGNSDGTYQYNYTDT